MKCNSCWSVLEGRAIATTCGHVFCPEDASRILKSDATCPVCEQLLSKSNMKAVELTPDDEWINMVMAGTPPPSIMKSAFKGVMFWLGQKEVESQLTISKAVQLKKKYEEMQTKYMEKLEQVHAAYQKAMKKCQLLEHEKENLVKDKNELQEKYTEKSRQKRKLEEMYESLRSEYEHLKRGNSASKIHKDRMMVQRPAHYNPPSTSHGFDDDMRKAGGDAGFFDGPPMQAPRGRIRGVSSPSDGVGLNMRDTRLSGAGTDPFKMTDPTSMFTPAGGHPASALRNLLLSPMKKQSSRLRSGLSR